MKVDPTSNEQLLVTQGFDGIEACGFDGGVHAKEKADAHGNAHGKNYGPKRNRRRQAGHGKVDQQADAAAEQNADDAARASEHDRFGQKLPDDVAAPRAEGFTDADF